MDIKGFVEQKKESLMATNKELADQKLRIEGAWTIVCEIEEMLKAKDEKVTTEDETTPTTEGNETTTKTTTKKGSK